MPTVTYLEAIRQGLWEEMERDSSVFCIGEDIGMYGGAFKVTDGLIDRFGPERVIDTPIAEMAIVATLVAVTDSAEGASEVHVSAKVVDGLAEISLTSTPRGDGIDPMPFEPGYRQLEWADVHALALAEAVALVRKGDRTVMRLPRAVATAPLQIAPV